jgi:aspartate-semialdehyde dehydrogenase
VGRDITIGVAGATGALGSELLNVLDAAPWRPDRVTAIARTSTSTPFVEYGEQQLPVEDVALTSWADLDGLIVALPRDAAGPIVAAASEHVPVVDCSGSQLTDLEVPLVLPWLDTAPLEAPRARDVVSVPSGAGSLLAALLGPLARGGWSGTASATVLLPASTWGRDGVDELSKQVVALFNQSTPPRRVFDSGLAFDVLPQVGATAATGWSAAEVRVATELARLVGVRVDVTLLAVPVFGGVSATVRLDGTKVDAEVAAQLLAASGIEVAEGALRDLPRPRRIDGAVLPQAARVRDGMDGNSVHLWGAMDNLRATASAAVGAMAALLQDRNSE